MRFQSYVRGLMVNQLLHLLVWSAIKKGKTTVSMWLGACLLGYRYLGFATVQRLLNPVKIESSRPIMVTAPMSCT